MVEMPAVAPIILTAIQLPIASALIRLAVPVSDRSAVGVRVRLTRVMGMTQSAAMTNLVGTIMVRWHYNRVSLMQRWSLYGT